MTHNEFRSLDSVARGSRLNIAAQIAHQLGGKRSGAGYVAKCPAHQDGIPSLSISAQHGKILVHCHAGCQQRDVVDALKSQGLWPEAEQEQGRRIVAEYNYTDENGDLLYQIVRFEPKDFRPRYLDGAGGWTYKKHPVQVLYHLREVLEAPIVFVVEGEKDVDKLREHGFAATTNAGGAKARWLPQYTETLRGREVYIIPDNDSPGWQRATVIARALLGSAARISILDLPEQIKDISDWFTVGHSECELIAMLEAEHAV
jgi:DNA primase